MNNLRRAILASILGLALCALTPAAHSWGDVGHRITGHVANTLLTEKTRRELRGLVDTDDIAALATWMDDERAALADRLPASPRWHYENREVCGAHMRQCPENNCVTAQIKLKLSLIADRQASRHERADALRMLVHLIGDIHQPLHLADNHDRGGNDAYVRLPNARQARRLHELWDSIVVRRAAQGRSSKRQAGYLLRKYSAQLSRWGDANIDAWAEDSFRLGRRYGYEALPGFVCGSRSGDVELTDAYIDAAEQVASEQLTKAGVRIAYLLNEAFDR